jgi:hypothetical protein
VLKVTFLTLIIIVHICHIVNIDVRCFFSFWGQIDPRQWDEIKGHSHRIR